MCCCEEEGVSMEDKFCSGCGAELEKGQAFCPKCGKKVGSSETKKEAKKNEIEEVIDKQEEYNKSVEEYAQKRKTSGGDIARYIFGGLFFLGGIYNLVQGKWYCIFNFLLALSFFPFIYRNLLCRFIYNGKLLRSLQIILPIAIFVLMIVAIPTDDTNTSSNSGSNNNSSIFKNETSEEKALRTVKGKLYPAYETVTSADINTETGNYDFKIKENKEQLSAYVCASDVQYLAKQVVGLEKVGNIEFECARNGETFYYVLVENVGSITADSINANTKYFDSNHNSLNTNIDTLKANVVSDYKKACATYSYKDVLRNPSDYKGKQAYWFGEIVQVVDKSAYSSTFRIDVTCEKYSYSDGYYCDDTIYVTYYGDQSFIEDDMVKMWGTMEGTQTYTTVLGASVTIPKFSAQYMELQ